MSNNLWLYRQLVNIPNLSVDSEFHPLITVKKNGITYKIYTPNSDEYLIDVDVVQKAITLGANVISYPTSWCRATGEAISYGKVKKIQVIPHGRLFEILN